MIWDSNKVIIIIIIIIYLFIILPVAGKSPRSQAYEE